MGKLYTLDEKLLIGTPEVRIGDKVYPVDDRQKTVKKLMKLTESEKDLEKNMDEVLKLAFGEKAAREIDEKNLPFPAYQRLFEIVVAAMTGEEPEAVGTRFQTAEQSAGQQSVV
ncbi:hypothetical protein [Faecalispora anaeroviscerum]|uniref:hypothetical protein n=1 Tax=Faecalispora anaeroviscerum TaxID=2991836 RepID=UPI0024B95CEF|nr:hypothetical protein [Faecalispora anaeroviscerum]